MRAEGCGLRVEGAGITRVSGVGLWVTVYGSGVTVYGFGFWVTVYGFGLWVTVYGCSASDFDDDLAVRQAVGGVGQGRAV